MRRTAGLLLLLLQLGTLSQARPRLHQRQEQSQDTTLPKPSEVAADENDQLKEWWYYDVPQQPSGGKPRPKWQYEDNKDWYGETTITSAGPTETKQVEAPIGVKAAKNEDSGDVDIALSPGMTSKIEAAFKGAPPCTGSATDASACGLGAALATLSKDKEVSGALQQSTGILAETIELSTIGGEGEFTLLAPQAIKTLGLTALTEEQALVLGGVFGVSLIAQVWHVFSNGGNNVVEPIVGVPSKSIAKVALDKFVDAVSSDGTDDNDDSSKTCVDSKDLAEWPICSHQDCSGEGENGKKCSAGDKKGCRCLEEYVVYAELRNMAALDFDTSTKFDATKINAPECKTDARAYFGPGVFKSMASLFCNLHTEREQTAEISAADDLLIKDAVEPKVSFSRKSKDDECVMDCMGMANRLLKDCNDSSDIADGGKITDACGELSYEIVKPQISPKCEVNPTDMPLNVFSIEEEGQLKAAKGFCKQWNKDKESSMHSNINGDERAVRNAKRTPPANAKAYTDWWIDFFYKPNEQGGECQRTCDEAFKEIAKSCTSNSGGQYLYENSAFDVGCGTFSLEITEPGPRYNKQFYKDNQLKRRKWTCDYTTGQRPGQIFGSIPVCKCVADCESCKNLTPIDYSDTEGGCSNSQGDDKCSDCRPWEYLCRNQHCKGKKWSDCPQCHVIFQDQ